MFGADFQLFWHDDAAFNKCEREVLTLMLFHVQTSGKDPPARDTRPPFPADAHNVYTVEDSGRRDAGKDRPHNPAQQPSAYLLAVRSAASGKTHT